MKVRIFAAENNNFLEATMKSFSVVIPLWNDAAHIERAIRSVLEQTVQPLEILIVDDGSTDNSADVVRQMESTPILRLICQPNAGVSAARNRGIAEAKGDYIAFLDSDDEWMSNHLEVIDHLIDKFPHCGLFGTSYYMCRPGESPTLPVIPQKWTFQGEEGIMDNYYEMASGVNPPIHMNSFAVRKSVIQGIGGFPVGIVSAEDTITLARLHAVCDFAYSRTPTSVYYLYFGANKNHRPVLRKNPLDSMFYKLLRTASHRKGVRRYVASWHKGRMVSALVISHDFPMAIREFFLSFSICPWQTKLFTSLAMSLLSLATHRSLYDLHLSLSRVLTVFSVTGQSKITPKSHRT